MYFRRFSWALAVICSIVSIAQAGDWVEKEYPAVVVVEIMDGGSFRALIWMDGGGARHLGGLKPRYLPVCFQGVDSTKLGAQAFLEKLLLNQRVVLRVKENREAKLKCDIDGRVLADVFIFGWDVGRLMMDQGLALPRN